MRKKTELRSVPELIAHKRDGGALTEGELTSLVNRYAAGELPDYQMAALAMAIFFRGMTPAETTAFTLAMRDSGRVMDLSKIPGTKVDKHSTGGVGDKISISLAPIVAACGVPVPMMAGRGLGHTGGTLDKLEAIPGFHVDLTPRQFQKQLAKLGCAIIGQTADLAPADKRLYALRDVTATIESVPLITGSILSKKLAEGLDGLVMDVKVGRGAFMKNVDDARVLAKSLVRVGRQAGKDVRALLTRMDDPLGLMIGNSLEVQEAFLTLRGEGPADLLECTLALGAEMLQMGGVSRSRAEAQRRLLRAMRDGSAAKLAERMIAAQGGDPRVVAEPDRLPSAKVRVPVLAPRGGTVQSVDPLELGLVGVALGAGRTKTEDVVDPRVGIELAVVVGERVAKGKPLAYLHVNERRGHARHLSRVRDAFKVGPRAVAQPKLVIERITR
jgi:pyrimidine-nucleoside phosphorylase